MRVGTLVRLLVAVLVAVLTAGAGLGGFVRAFAGTPEHVCTCATGGTHASCPVCNPKLREEKRSAAPAFDGVPCGDGAGAVQTAADPGVLPAPWLAPAPAIERSVTARPLLALHGRLVIEPPTPPPRSTAV